MKIHGRDDESTRLGLYWRLCIPFSEVALSRPSVSHRSSSVAGLLVILLSVALLSGCAQLREWTQWEEEDDDDARATEEVEDAAPEYSYRQVVQWLQSGEYDKAERSLEARVETEPDDHRAQSLLQQLRVDPEEQLGSESVDYEIQSGDTLSVIAQRFLGDNRQFLILARYNDIEVPGQLRVGQRIRIPADAHARGHETASEADELTQQAWAYLEAGQPEDALSLLADTSDARYRDEQWGEEEWQVLSEAHEAWVDKALGQGELTLAERRLTEAKEAEPASADWSAWMDEAERRIRIESQYQHGRAYRDEDPKEAALAFSEVLELDPDHAGARRAMAHLQETVVPGMHREAILRYRNHDLEEAIEIWENLLVIAPQFEPARAYKARASELQARLEDMD